MGIYAIPPKNAGVWVEFEQGDPNYPIWSGCWWGSSLEVPVLALAGVPTSPNIVVQTTGQNAVVISDVPGPTGGIMLKSSKGQAMILINDTHILITNGQASIELFGNTVSINGTALMVV
jgi:uncharacterized protein involved in type VI secretion and phage assembly